MCPIAPALRTDSHQSPQWQFWNDPAMKPFHDKFVAKWDEEFAAPLEHDLGVGLEDVESAAAGPVRARPYPEQAGTAPMTWPPDFYCCSMREPRAACLKTNLAGLRQKWVQAGKPLPQTENLHGIPFSVVTLSSNDVPGVLAKIFPAAQPVQELGKEDKPSPPGKLFVGQFQSLLIAGNSKSSVETVAARLTGGSNPCLSDNPIFAADRVSQFHGKPLYYGWFNARTFFDVLDHIPPAEPNPDAPSPFPAIPWMKILDASGFTGLKSISFACRDSRERAHGPISSSPRRNPSGRDSSASSRPTRRMQTRHRLCRRMW